MTPYYQDSSVTLWLGDCREVLPSLDLSAVDVVLTDPPFGVEGTSYKCDYSSDFEDTPAFITHVVVPVVVSLTATVGCVVVTPGNRNFSAYPQPVSFGAFYQPAAIGLQTFGNLDAQPIFYYGKNASGRVMGQPCSYVLTETSEDNGHPCPKPLKAWTRLLKNISKPGQCVLDPFNGSGTTLRAAKDLGITAIGIELNEAYCEIAAKRLSQGALPLEFSA